ncbi:MAG: hypothetical protein ACK4E7_15145 [Permianibacter sp.]
MLAGAAGKHLQSGRKQLRLPQQGVRFPARTGFHKALFQNLGNALFFVCVLPTAPESAPVQLVPANSPFIMNADRFTRRRRLALIS